MQYISCQCDQFRFFQPIPRTSQSKLQSNFTVYLFKPFYIHRIFEDIPFWVWYLVLLLHLVFTIIRPAIDSFSDVFPSLRSLDLSGVKNVIISNSISKLPHLTRLILREFHSHNNMLSIHHEKIAALDISGSSLFVILLNMPELVEFDFHNISSIKTLTLRVPKLSEISFESIKDIDLSFLGDQNISLAKFKNVSKTFLRITSQFKPPPSTYIFDSFSFDEHDLKRLSEEPLEGIELSNITFDEEGAVITHPTAKQLTLKNCELGLLQLNFPSLEKLIIKIVQATRSRQRDSGFDALLDYITKNSQKLRVLDLDGLSQLLIQPKHLRFLSEVYLDKCCSSKKIVLESADLTIFRCTNSSTLEFLELSCPCLIDLDLSHVSKLKTLHLYCKTYRFTQSTYLFSYRQKFRNYPIDRRL